MVQALLTAGTTGDYDLMARALITIGVTSRDVNIPVRIFSLRLSTFYGCQSQMLSLVMRIRTGGRKSLRNHLMLLLPSIFM